MQVEVRLYAVLRLQARADATNGVFSVDLPAGSTVTELLDLIRIAHGEVHMIMVNGTGRALETVLQDGDRVGLFPPVGGG